MSNRTPPPVIEREVATLAETKADRYREYSDRSYLRLTKRSNKKKTPPPLIVNQTTEAALLMVHRDQKASAELAKFEEIAKNRSLEVKQFNDIDKQELADQIRSNRARAVERGVGSTTLTGMISAILDGSHPVAVKKRRTVVENARDKKLRVEGSNGAEIKYGSDKESIVAGWQAILDNGEKLPLGQCVYIIYGAGLYKIGMTNKIGERLGCLQVGSPVPLSLSRAIVCFDGKMAAKNVERCLHDTFSEKNVHGEWFALNDEDLSYLDISCQEWLVKASAKDEAEAA